MRTAKQILATIRTIKVAAERLQTKIQDVALECLAHAAEHGDATLMDALVKALPRGQRVEALVLWVEAHSPIRWTKDEDGERAGVGMLKQSNKKYVAFDLEAAEATPYYSFTKENEKKPLTLEALLKLIKNVEKRIDKAEDDGLIAEGEDVTVMKAYAKALAGIDPATITVQ